MAMALVAMTTQIVLATNCWSGGENRGYKDGMDMTGPAGATKRCEAKLHVCFKGGSGDPAIPCHNRLYDGMHDCM